MFVAVTPQNFRVYGSFGYGDIIFNDLKLPATKGTDLKQTMAQVSLEGLVAFQPDQMFIVNFGMKLIKFTKTTKQCRLERQ